jgi:methionyl-tRNA formyltransferase
LSERVVFFGTPEFAVPSLEALARLADAGVVELAAVVTQPDRRGDRRRIAVPPVKARAITIRVPLLQPARLSRDAIAEITALRPDALVWAAYGNLIPAALIDAARKRAMNVHASLLPRWRGAAPVAHAILAGDRETGITLMEGTPALDAGPILAQERIAIGPTETAGELTSRLAALGARMLERDLPRYLRGELRGSPQTSEHATVAAKVTTKDGVIEWSRPADEIARRVRAMSPEPGAHTVIKGQRLVITRATVDGGSPAENGTVRVRGGVPHVAAGAGWVRLEEVRPAGKRTMSGADWARGVRDLDGARVPS